MTSETTALELLETLTSFGPRFHGTEGMADAAAWIEGELIAMGHGVRRESVPLPGWHPGSVRRVSITAPYERDLPAWPMLWSAGGTVRGRLETLGPEGLWGDSIVWQRFGVRDAGGEIASVIHARDGGPAAPQPLPAGSDDRIPHLAIGHVDGLQLAEWIADHPTVEVEVELDSEPRETSVSDNLIVDIAGSDNGSNTGTGTGTGTHAVVCAHLDTFYNTVGAYDNGSGSIALLELARIWAETPPARAVRLIFFTAEEWHLGGSRHHVAALADVERDRVDLVLNIDGLGRSDFLETFAGPERFGFAIRDAVARHAATTGRTLRTVDRFPPTKGTDDASFHAVGIPSAFFTFNDLHRLHQPEDLPDPGIARNIVWTVPLAREIAERMPRPERTDAPGLL